METYRVDILAVFEPLVGDVIGVTLRLTVELHTRPLVGGRVLGRRHDVGVTCNNRTTLSTLSVRATIGVTFEK